MVEQADNHDVYQALGHREVDSGMILTDDAIANIWLALKAAGLEIVRADDTGSTDYLARQQRHAGNTSGHDTVSR